MKTKNISLALTIAVLASSCTVVPKETGRLTGLQTLAQWKAEIADTAKKPGASEAKYNIARSKVNALLTTTLPTQIDSISGSAFMGIGSTIDLSKEKILDPNPPGITKAAEEFFTASNIEEDDSYGSPIIAASASEVAVDVLKWADENGKKQRSLSANGVKQKLLELQWPSWADLTGGSGKKKLARQTKTPRLVFPYYTDQTEESYGAALSSPENADLTQIADGGDDFAKAELDQSSAFSWREIENDDQDSYGASNKPFEWRAADSLMKLRSQLKVLAPNRDKKDDGMVGDPAHQSRKSDHNPWIKDQDIGVVTAYDVTNSPSTGCDVNILVQSLVSSKDSRIKYVIWKRRIVNSDPIGLFPAWTWRPYNGSNPHDKHMHLSVLPSKYVYDNDKEWSIRVKNN